MLSLKVKLHPAQAEKVQSLLLIKIWFILADKVALKLI